MTLKRLGLTFVAFLALGAVFAGSAFAKAETTTGHWHVAGVKLTSGETRERKCSAATPLTFTILYAGTKIEFEAGKLECLSGPVIRQEGEQAIATGKLKFSELKFLTPEGCTVEEPITTKAVTEKVQMGGTTPYVLFEPTEGTTLANITFGGCAIYGNYTLKGTFFGRPTDATGTESADQPLEFSESIQKTAGGSLTFLSEPVYLSGKANEELVAGSAFGVSES